MPVETVYQLPDGAPSPVVQKRRVPFRNNIIFMPNNTTQYLATVFARRGKSIQWPDYSLDLNPLENSEES